MICLRKRNNNRNKKRGTGLGLIFLFVLSICGVVTIKKQSLNKEQIIAQARFDELEEEKKLEEEFTKQLEDQAAYMQTNKFKEEVARDKFGLVYEDEYMFKSKEEK